MIEIKVVMELPGIPEALNNLANALRNQGCLTVTSGYIAREDAVETEPETETVANEIHEEATPAADAVEILNTDTVAAIASNPAPEEKPEKKYTFKQISSAGAALCADLSKMEQLVSLLNDKYKVPAITMIPETRYAELAADLIALGAVIEEE